MALVQCKECGHHISKSAEACPQCGAGIPHTSLWMWIVLILFVVVFVSTLIVDFTDSSGAKKRQAAEVKRAEAERAAEAKKRAEAERDRQASLTSEQRAAEAKKRADEEAAKKEREAQQLGLRWSYEESPDEMGRGNIKTAAIRSVNEIQFKFPYQGAQRAWLQLRLHPRYGKDVILSIERGQFLCRIDTCNVTVRFDQGTPQTYTALGPADHSTTVLFIRTYDRFLANLRKSRQVYIEAQFYQEGLRVFEFDVAGLKW